MNQTGFDESYISRLFRRPVLTIYLALGARFLWLQSVVPFSDSTLVKCRPDHRLSEDGGDNE